MITGFGVLGFQIYTDFRARFGPSGVGGRGTLWLGPFKQEDNRQDRKGGFHKSQEFLHGSCLDDVASTMCQVSVALELIVKQLTLFCAPLLEGNVATSY